MLTDDQFACLLVAMPFLFVGTCFVILETLLEIHDRVPAPVRRRRPF